MSDANLATVRRFWDALNARDVDAYLATFTEDGVAHDPVTRPPLRTSDERRAFLQGMLDTFSDVSAGIDYLTPCGDSTAVKWTIDATTTGGDPVRIEGIDIYRHAADGRIAEMWGYFQM